MYNGRSEENEQWLRNSPDENVEFCTSDRLFYLSKVRLYIQKGKYGMALGLLHKLLFYSPENEKAVYSYGSYAVTFCSSGKDG